MQLPFPLEGILALVSLCKRGYFLCLCFHAMETLGQFLQTHHLAVMIYCMNSSVALTVRLSVFAVLFIIIFKVDPLYHFA